LTYVCVRATFASLPSDKNPSGIVKFISLHSLTSTDYAVTAAKAFGYKIPTPLKFASHGANALVFPPQTGHRAIKDAGHLLISTTSEVAGFITDSPKTAAQAELVGKVAWDLSTWAVNKLRKRVNEALNPQAELLQQLGAYFKLQN
ncbi:MAG: hypothetical protein FWF79_03295, partial [Defluviitaleaceae bacterium]|nr:hypothetical protein [Defluviitaleaceae bacterium]